MSSSKSFRSTSGVPRLNRASQLRISARQAAISPLEQSADKDGIPGETPHRGAMQCPRQRTDQRPNDSSSSSAESLSSLSGGTSKKPLIEVDKRAALWDKVKIHPGLDQIFGREICNDLYIPRSGAHDVEKVIGQDEAKWALDQAIVYALRIPHLMGGLNEASKSILLYGPPGTGKTLLSRSVAASVDVPFFFITPSSLTRSTFGDTEKVVRALFQVAEAAQPCVLFLDEADIILSKRKTGEHEASGRLKSEFLPRFEELTNNHQVVILAASNLPKNIDEAFLSRFHLQLYVALPDEEGRFNMLNALLDKHRRDGPLGNDGVELDEDSLRTLAKRTKGYSGRELGSLGRAAGAAASVRLRAVGDPLRRSTGTLLKHVDPIRYEHFEQALRKIRPTVSAETLAKCDAYAGVSTEQQTAPTKTANAEKDDDLANAGKDDDLAND